MLHAFNFDGRRRNRQHAVSIYRVRHAAGVPELGENRATFFVYRIGYFFPAFYLFGSVQAGSKRAADRIGGNIDGFG